MAPMPFGKLLKQDSVVSSQELEEAYQRQVLFGGRLGTNLLEIKALDEATLLEYLSRSAGIPWAGRELIEKPDWDLAERVDVELVQRFKAFPARRIGRSVIAVVTDPLSGPRLHEFESSLGATIVQHITSEFRFWQLLKRAYDLELPPRYATLIERFPLDKSPADSRLPLAKDKDDLDSIEQPDLSLQRALEATLMERHSSKTPPSPVISAGSRKLSPKNIGSNRFGGGTLIGFQNVFTPPEGHKNTEDDQPRVPSTPRLKSPPKFPSDLTPTPTPAPSNATAQPEPDLAATPSAPKAAAEPPPAAAVLVKKKRRRKKKRSTSAGPLSLPAFVQQLEHSQDREELLNAFAAFVTSYGSRCAMLAYEADKLTGIAVHGKRGAFPIPQVEIRLRPGSDIFRVCQGRSYYQGGAATGELASLFRQLKVPSPDEVLVVPIAIGASLELLAILDNGATPLVYSPDLVLRGALELSRALQPFAKRQPSTPAQVPEAPAKADVGEPETHASAEKPVAAEAGIEIEDFAEAAVEAEAVEAEAVEAEAVEAEAVEAEAVEAEAAVEAEVAVEAEATVEAEAANPEPHSSGPEALDIPEPAESGGEDMDIPDLDFSLSGIGDEDDEEDIPSLSTSSDATRSDAASMEIDEATAEQDALLDLSIDELPSDPEPLSQEHLRLPTLQVISLDEIEKAAEAAEREKAAQAALDRTSSSDESLPEIDAVELLSDDGLDLIEVELVPDSEDDLGSLSRSDFEFWLTNLDGRDEVLAERAREIFTSESPAVRAFLLESFPGRLRIDRYTLGRVIPPAREHSRLLGCLVVAPNVEADLAKMLRETSADTRFYALLVLNERRVADEVVAEMAKRLFDKDHHVRALATRAVRARNRHNIYEQLIARLLEALQGDDERHTELALAALGGLREFAAIHAVLEHLGSALPRVRDAARHAATLITLNDGGTDRKKWDKIVRSCSRERTQILAEAMVHKERQIRVYAAEELTEFPGLMVNYHPDAHKREWAKARDSFLKWVESNPELAGRNPYASQFGKF